VETPSKEVLTILGPPTVFPSLDSISLVRTEASAPIQVLLMTNNAMPDAQALSGLYAQPFDSLIRKNYIFDTHFIYIKILKFFKKKIVFQFVGSDIIQRDIAMKYQIFTPEQFDIIYPLHDDIFEKMKLKK
jgi:hypothetical protein